MKVREIFTGDDWPKDLGTPMHLRSDEAVKYAARNPGTGRKQKLLHIAALKEAAKRGITDFSGTS